MKKSAKLPWLKWNKKDWLSDERLRMCSLAAREVWHEICLIADDCEPRGHFRPGGTIPSVQDIGRLLSAATDEIEAALAELERRQVFSRTPEGAIYSRRIVRDAKRSRTNSKNGKLGGNPALSDKPDSSESDKRPDKPEDIPHGRTRAPARAHVRSNSLSDSSESDSSPAPETHARAKDGHVPIPESLNSPAFRVALETFEAGKPKGRHKVHGLRILLRDLEPYGADVAVRALEQATVGQWQSVDPTRLPEFQRGTSNGRNGHDFNEPKGFQPIRDRIAGKTTQIEPLLALLTPAKIPGGKA